MIKNQSNVPRRLLLVGEDESWIFAIDMYVGFQTSINAYLKKSIPASPVRCKVLLPSLSINGIVTKVMNTMIAPTPRVAYGASDSATPDDLKKSVE